MRPAIGQRCGKVVFAGEIDGSPVYVEAEPHEESLPWKQATAACAALGPGWRLPTKEELKLLFDGRKAGALAGTLDPVWHWSSTPVTGLFTPWVRNLATGERGTASIDNAYAARCVRVEEGSARVRGNDRY